MHDRTGGQTTVGVSNIAFGAMGVVLTVLLFVFGPTIQSDLARTASSEMPGVFISRMPTADMTSAVLELAMGAAWIALIFAGLGVLRVEAWGRRATIVVGGAMAFIGSAKIIDGGLSFITLGFVFYGFIVASLFMRADWRAMYAGRARFDSDLFPLAPGDVAQDETDEARHVA